MKKVLRSCLTLLLSMAMCLNLFTIQATAGGMNENAWTSSVTESAQKGDEAEKAESGSQEIFTADVVYINPLYEDVIQEADLNFPSVSYSYNQGIAAAEVSEYCTSIDEAGAEVCSYMKEREETVEVGLETTEVKQGMSTDEIQKIITDFIYEIFEKAVEHTGDPVEGDYLKWQYAGFKGSASCRTQKDKGYVTVKYTITYYTTRAQEDKVDAEVEKVLSKLNLSGKNDYNKIKGVYDYICENVTYDYDNLKDDDYKLKYTAYAALINKTAVCQGYAVLFYRFALELGVDARLIPGKGNGESHAWNIARIDKKYYNLDSTWDAGDAEYSYFLKCNANFGDHVRDEEYETKEFNAAYPMAAEDYVSSENPFEDVPEDEYYTDAVIWAYEKGITSGVDETHFRPEQSCTRGQVVTFLWRAEGKPEAKSEECPFMDLNPSDYYYDAVLWAYENGIANGMEENYFKPDETVTRGQFVTFLHRTKGKPASQLESSPFVDVPEGEYYTDAVLWAYENDITTGTDDSHFSPEAPCNRGDVVTFLYRAYE